LQNFHIRRHETVSCLFNDCGFATNVAGTWRSHFCRNHNLTNAEKGSLRHQLVISHPTLTDSTESDEDNCENYRFDSTNEVPDDEQGTVLTENEIEKSMATFFLKMQVVWNIPEYMVQDIFDTFVELHNASLQRERGFNTHDCASLRPAQSATAESRSFFEEQHSLGTSFRRRSYFVHKMPHVKPGKILMLKIYNCSND